MKPSEPANWPTLAPRFAALGRFVELVSPHLESSGVDIEPLKAATRLSRRAAARERLSSGYTVVALAGATGGGKSSLFNSLARMELSPIGHLRPTTGEPYACVWGGRGADPLLDWLEVPHRFYRESVLDAQSEAAMHGLVLLDLPDVDSIATGHRVESDRLVGIVDLVVWVLDPQKYADQTVHEDYLRHLGALHDVTVVVLNQIDRLSSADVHRCHADLVRIVEADGLAGVPVIPISAVTGAGVGDVRTLLEKTVAGRHAATIRLEGELKSAVEALRSYVASGSEPTTGLPADAQRRFDDDLAAAAGVDAIAAAVGREYLVQAVVPAWPSRRVEPPSEAPPADPAAVRAAARQLASEASASLVPPWPDHVQSVAAEQVDHVTELLGAAVARARPTDPHGSRWSFVRGAWWVVVICGLFGLGWLIRGIGNWSGLPTLGPIPVPVLIVGVSVALAVMIALVSRPFAAAGGRRARSGARQRVRTATDGVAADALAPIRAVVRDHAEAVAALETAAGS